MIRTSELELDITGWGFDAAVPSWNVLEFFQGADASNNPMLAIPPVTATAVVSSTIPATAAVVAAAIAVAAALAPAEGGRLAVGDNDEHSL